MVSVLIDGICVDESSQCQCALSVYIVLGCLCVYQHVWVNLQHDGVRNILSGFGSLHSCHFELVFKPHFFRIMARVKAFLVPHFLKFVVGLSKGMLCLRTIMPTNLLLQSSLTAITTAVDVM